MTGPGFADALSRFSTDLDAAVVRARRVAAEARETSAKFRRETRQMADNLRSGRATVSPDQLTDDRLRRAASGFRADHGLPVERLPEGRDLLRPAPRPTPATGSGSAVPPSGVPTAGPGGSSTTAGAPRTTPTARRTPPPGDDDEDFSQARIMR